MNENLKRAKDSQFNEFYTTYESVADELKHYWAALKGKIVYCNCDIPYKSQFWAYLSNNFKAIGLKELWSTYYAPDKNGLFTKFDGDRMLSTYLRGDGDFRSDECVELLKKCDVVLTNGPFSLNTSLLFLALEHKKDFLLLGTQNLITSRAVFESFMKGEFWLGYTSGTFKFLIPKDYNLGKITQDNEGNRYAHLGNIAWYTNLKVEKEYKILELTQWYHPSLHQTFNNSNIINVDKVSDIPRDYDGIMGVPISYLTRHNPQQFKILGLINSEKWIGIKCLARIGTRMVYNRVLIQRNDTQSINPVFECKNIKYY